MSYGISALSWVPVHEKHCLHSPRVKSLFLLVLWSSCTQAPLAFKAKCSGAPTSNVRPSGWGAWCGTQNSLVEEPLWYNYFPIYGSLTQWVWDLIMSWKCPSHLLLVASSLSLDVEYLFLSSFSLLCWWSSVNWVWSFHERKWSQVLLLCHLISGGEKLHLGSTSERFQFIYCWSLAWRILSITLLACGRSTIVQ